MSYNLLDAGVIAIILISTILAYSRGLVREGMSLLGWIVALIVAAQFARFVVPLIENLPFIRDYVAGSCELLTVVGFVVLFIFMMVVMSLLTPLFTNFIKSTSLGLIDSALGGIFGFLRGCVIIILAFVVYSKFIGPSTKMPTIEDSRSYAIFEGPRKNVEDSLPNEDQAPIWLTNQFDKITKHCTGEQPNA